MPLLVFVFSMFVSAAALFLIEPMIAKMMLPKLGGTPAVWNTCMVFFQATLLAGYLYAHASIRWFGRKVQVAVQIALVSLPLLLSWPSLLHLYTGSEPPTQSNPTAWLLLALLISAGLPFFALASSAPLLQKWFATSGHEHAPDPYFLYSASNAGSLAGLLLYPLVLEVLLPLTAQRRLWSCIYLLFVLITLICGLMAMRWPDAHTDTVSDESPSNNSHHWLQRLRWLALAFVPSSLMLGVTTALTTDMPAIPLLWVLPLALYLLSFVLVFAKKPPISHAWLVRHLPFLLLCALIPPMSQTRIPLILALVLNLVLLWAVAMVCHGELARSRPPVRRITEFYLWMSAGGVIGGIFNSLVAPVVFKTALEYPLVLILAALFRPAINAGSLSNSRDRRRERNDWLLPLLFGVCMVAVVLGLRYLDVEPTRTVTILLFGWSAVWCLSFGRRTFRFAAGLAAMLLASSLYIGPYGRPLDTQRSFFGVLRVTNDPTGKFRYLLHGGTIHGIQSLDPAQSREPLAYYTRSGPAADIFRAAAQLHNANGNFAVVGLGAGALACYAKPGQTFTYFEIDPLVVRIATDPRYFTFLSQCAPQAGILLGDARMKLRDVSSARYSLIVLDAFSGDTIPLHLLTREALALYRQKLIPGGILAFHISNRYVELAPTLSNLALDQGMSCLLAEDSSITQAQADQGKLGSEWMVMANTGSALTSFAEPATTVRWVHINGNPDAKVWTDDYSNLLTAIRWR